MHIKKLLPILASTAVILLSCAQDPGSLVRNNPLDNNGTNWNPPVVTAMADVSLNINDSLVVTAVGTDNGSIVKYVWARNGGSVFGDTTVMGSLKVAYADSGRKNVVVKVVDDDGAVSVKADTCVVRVTLDPPVVTAMAAVSVNIKDSLTITATAVDNGSIAKYVWALDGINYVDTTVAGSIRTAYMTVGVKSLKVRAIDDDGVLSTADLCMVTVTLDPPVVTVMHDTTVSFAVTDSVVVTAHAVDFNASGSIVRYLWDTGADGVWDDSATTGSRTIKSITGGAITVRWGARDDDGLLVADTFEVVFNRPPNSPTVTAPTIIAGWGTTFNYATGKGTLPLTLSATDPDGAVDTLRYTCFTGATAGVLTQQYTGTAATYNLAAVNSSATVYWRLVVRDKFGDSASATGSFIAPPPPPPPPPAGMKLIAAGTFDMGQVGVAEPAHSVTLSAFWMDSIEVTQSDYLALMGVNPSNFSGVTRGPVETVTWFDAVLYCNKRSKREGKDTVYKYTSITGTAGNGCTVLGGLVIDTSKSGYRLPTEAQWEYACRAGTTTDYYWGNNTIDSYTWYSGNSGSTTHTVATKLPNAWGLYDMSGNVWEWCNDWYGTYSRGAQTDPQGATSGSYRVLRGGSWYYNSSYLPSASRGNYDPDLRDFNYGFRAVCPR